MYSLSPYRPIVKDPVKTATEKARAWLMADDHMVGPLEQSGLEKTASGTYRVVFSTPITRPATFTKARIEIEGRVATVVAITRSTVVPGDMMTLHYEYTET